MGRRLTRQSRTQGERRWNKENQEARSSREVRGGICFMANLVLDIEIENALLKVTPRNEESVTHPMQWVVKAMKTEELPLYSLPGLRGGNPGRPDLRWIVRQEVTTLNTTISALFVAAESGEGAATDALFSALYSELHQMAKRELSRRGASPSLSVTTLLHEAYLDMSKGCMSFPDRARFMGYAARVMRGLIVDHARRRGAVKRGGEFELTSLESYDAASPADPKELSAMSDALDELAKIEPELAELVDLRFFCGFSFAELAVLKKQSERTIKRKWEKARIYLHQSIRSDLPL
jgi:RNA polymerase sigma factor (TIGR02999 family)